MIIRNTIGWMTALILCLPLAAQQDQIARFEIALVRSFGGYAGNDQPQPAEPKSEKSPDGNNVVPPTPSNSAAISSTRKLNLYVLVGARAVNSISGQSATAPVVEVRDERNLPVQGGEVIFQLPAAGPSGFFDGHKLTWTGTTDANGQVVAAGFTPNREAGPFSIRVTASHGDRMASAIIEQRNSLKPVLEGAGTNSGTSKHSRWWKIAAIAGAGGAAGGIIWATQRGGGKPTIILQPGTVSLGGPR